MAAYHYRALDPEGRKINGTLDSDSAHGARGILRSRGLFPIEVEEGRLDTTSRQTFRTPRLSGTELCLLTRQWATLLASGLTMEQSLSAMIDQAERIPVRQVLHAVRAEVLAGYSLRNALDRQPVAFPMVYRAAIGAGETSGQLSTMMLRLADYLEQRHTLRWKVLQIMIYPSIVALVAVTVVVGLMIYVVPQVTEVFLHSKQTLPWLTRALLFLSSGLQRFGTLLAALGIGLAFILYRNLQRPDFRRRWDARLLRVPLLGRLLRVLDTTRFASTLSILIGSGVPLLGALQAGRQVMTLIPLQDAVETAVEKVREGVSLSQALAQTGQFPPLLIHMVANGEATGQLQSLIQRAAQLQQTEVENKIIVLIGVLEPALLLAMGIMVMLIVLAIMEPIIEINQLMR
ncbi:MAG: type II secretion system inner membrane protein GspF [Proteobacteria bacterium]|nr:type II secretion system inner membrane protein GspF [Pseudomonadota bacterium]HQR02572.1 type II secretion system inner membrane protein GspF [Rhodocyclaceae bacterium]